MKSRDVVIVGGGVIGLSIAYCLAREGVAATVLDRDGLGQGASWAGAGMIPPHVERLKTNPTIELRSWSAILYPEWSRDLLEETGIDNGYRRTGGVDVAANLAEDNELKTSAGRWRNEKIVYERLSPSDFSRVEPALNPDLRVAYFLPDRAQIRNPRHLKALVKSCETRQVDPRPGSAVLGFESTEDRVTAVRLEAGSIPCGTVVVAAGAWSSGVLARLGVRVETPPLKGQIVLLRSPRPLLRRIVEHGKNYLVPRDDGRILVGATEEEAGFDTRTTPEALRDLLAEAHRLCPSLADAEVERSWAGLRPGSVDSKPYLGLAPGFSNVIVATGHKRAGLQLAPASAEVIADLVLGRTPRVDLTPYRLDREPEELADPTFRS
jgi:glycine oxidase